MFRRDSILLKLSVLNRPGITEMYVSSIDTRLRSVGEIFHCYAEYGKCPENSGANKFRKNRRKNFSNDSSELG